MLYYKSAILSLALFVKSIACVFTCFSMYEKRPTAIYYIM